MGLGEENTFDAVDGGGGLTGTPAGTYNLTLTATAGGVSKASTLTLTVN